MKLPHLESKWHGLLLWRVWSVSVQAPDKDLLTPWTITEVVVAPMRSLVLKCMIMPAFFNSPSSELVVNLPAFWVLFEQATRYLFLLCCTSKLLQNLVQCSRSRVWTFWVTPQFLPHHVNIGDLCFPIFWRKCLFRSSSASWWFDEGRSQACNLLHIFSLCERILTLMCFILLYKWKWNWNSCLINTRSLVQKMFVPLWEFLTCPVSGRLVLGQRAEVLSRITQVIYPRPHGSWRCQAVGTARWSERWWGRRRNKWRCSTRSRTTHMRGATWDDYRQLEPMQCVIM